MQKKWRLAITLIIILLFQIFGWIWQINAPEIGYGNNNSVRRDTLNVTFEYTYDSFGFPNANNPYGDDTAYSPPQTYYMDDNITAIINATYFGNFTNFLHIRYLYNGSKLVWSKLIIMDEDTNIAFNFTAGSADFGYGNYTMNITHFIGHIWTPDGVIINPPNMTAPFNSSSSNPSNKSHEQGVASKQISGVGQEDLDTGNQYYNLTIGIQIVEPGAGGTTDPPPGTYTYEEGTQVTIRAIPDKNSKVDHWSVNGQYISGTNEVTITMDKNYYVNVFFKLRGRKLTIKVLPKNGGTTDPSPGVHRYNVGEVVSITAYPNNDSGYYLDHWILDGEILQPENPITIKMDEDHVLRVVFGRVWFEERSEAYNFTVIPMGNKTAWMWMYPLYRFMDKHTKYSWTGALYYPYWNCENNISLLVLLIGVNGTEGRLKVTNITLSFYAVDIYRNTSMTNITISNYEEAIISNAHIIDNVSYIPILSFSIKGSEWFLLYPSVYVWNATTSTAYIAPDTIVGNYSGPILNGSGRVLVNYADYPGYAIPIQEIAGNRYYRPREAGPGEVLYIPIWYDAESMWKYMESGNHTYLMINYTIWYEDDLGEHSISATANITDRRFFAEMRIYKTEWNQDTADYNISRIYYFLSRGQGKLYLSFVSGNPPINFTTLNWTVSENVSRIINMSGGIANLSAAFMPLGNLTLEENYFLSGNNTIVRYFVERDIPDRLYLLNFSDRIYWKVSVVEPSGHLVKDVPPRIPILYPYVNLTLTYYYNGSNATLTGDMFPLREGRFTIYLNVRPGGLNVTKAIYYESSGIYMIGISAPPEEGGVINITVPELNFTQTLQNNTVYGLLGFSGNTTIYIEGKYFENITLVWTNTLGYSAKKTVKVEFISRWRFLSNTLMQIALVLLGASILIFLFDKYREKFWRLVRGQ